MRWSDFKCFLLLHDVRVSSGYFSHGRNQCSLGAASADSHLLTANCSPEKRNGDSEAPPCNSSASQGPLGAMDTPWKLHLPLRWASRDKTWPKIAFQPACLSYDKNGVGNIVSYPTSRRLPAAPLWTQPDFLPILLGHLSQAYHCRSWTPLWAADVTGASVWLSNLYVLAKTVSQQVCRTSRCLPMCLLHYGPFCCAVLRRHWDLLAKNLSSGGHRKFYTWSSTVSALVLLKPHSLFFVGLSLILHLCAEKTEILPYWDLSELYRKACFAAG